MPRLLFLAMLLLACACASAGDRGAWFRKLDRNHDGYLDRKELAGLHRHLAVFNQADENGDGKLDAEEFIRAEILVQEKKRGGTGSSPKTAEPVKKDAAPG